MSEPTIVAYVARHGTTSLNQRDAFRGPMDVPLDAQGYRDAHALAYYFQPIELSAIIHSGKIRTRETAKQIASRKHDLPVLENCCLQAWNVGDLAGQQKTKENVAIVEDHVKHPDIPMPGGESLNEFRSRIRPMLDQAIDIGCQYSAPLLLLAHSSVIHEVGTVIGGNHEHCLVKPGGAVAIFVKDGYLGAEPVFKPLTNQPEGGEAVT